MALDLHCPHCQGAMRLPEDSGGQSTCCPHCLRPLVISADGKQGLAPTAVAVPLPKASAVTPSKSRPLGPKPKIWRRNHSPRAFCWRSSTAAASNKRPGWRCCGCSRRAGTGSIAQSGATEGSSSRWRSAPRRRSS